MWSARRLVTTVFTTPLLRNVLSTNCSNNLTSLTRDFHCLAAPAIAQINKLSVVTQPALTNSTLDNNNCAKTLLNSITPLLMQVCGFKVKKVLRRRCNDCYYVIRQGRAYVMCKTHPRHKLKAMQKKPKNTWILTHATQSPVRPY